MSDRLTTLDFSSESALIAVMASGVDWISVVRRSAVTVMTSGPAVCACAGAFIHPNAASPLDAPRSCFLRRLKRFDMHSPLQCLMITLDCPNPIFLCRSAQQFVRWSRGAGRCTQDTVGFLKIQGMCAQ